jgi:hypothetical protein
MNSPLQLGSVSENCRCNFQRQLNASIVSHRMNLCYTVCIYIYSHDSAPAVGAFVAEETAEPFAFNRRLAAATVAALKAQVPCLTHSAFSLEIIALASKSCILLYIKETSINEHQSTQIVVLSDVWFEPKILIATCVLLNAHPHILAHPFFLLQWCPRTHTAGHARGQARCVQVGERRRRGADQ